MKLQTPEIAWHETKPIYSCDLQPFEVPKFTENSERKPFAELEITDPISEELDTELDSEKPQSSTQKVKESEGETKSAAKDEEDVFGKTWTRLATVGGDNIVRMWRVNLKWEPPTKVPVTVTVKKGHHGEKSVAEVATPSDKGASRKIVSVAQGLVFLANLKRHDSNINVVRWSPTGMVFGYILVCIFFVIKFSLLSN